MPEPAEALRQALAAESSAYVPDPDLPRRIARRTLQLQRRRRSRIVGAVAVIAAAAIALPLVVNPVLTRSNQVSVASYGPTPTTRRSTTTTSSTLPPSLWAFFIPQPAPVLPAGLAAALESGKKLTQAQIRRFERELRALAAVQVLGATATRGLDLAGLAGLAGLQLPSPITTTTRPGETATTAPTEASTTTTTAPQPTTTTTRPVVPLSISGPTTACAAVPTAFHAAGTYAAQVLWNNGTVGASATYVFPAAPPSANVSASVSAGGTNSTQQISVQVIPTGTAPC